MGLQRQWRVRIERPEHAHPDSQHSPKRRPIRSVLDDLLDRYDVVDISVADPPLEEIVSHIYARPV